MDSILMGRIVIKDGITMLETDTDFWIRNPKEDNPESDNIKPVKTKATVCWDCDFAYFVPSECGWFCCLIDKLTKGYCEAID